MGNPVAAAEVDDTLGIDDRHDLRQQGPIAVAQSLKLHRKSLESEDSIGGRPAAQHGAPKRLLEIGLLFLHVAGCVALAKSKEPGLPVYLLGHSAGGVVACLYTLANQADVRGLICESFAFRLPAPDLQ